MQGILLGLADVIDWLLWAVQILVFLYWVLALVGADPYNPIVAGVRRLAEPMLGWLRRRLPFLVQGQWDLSPVALFLICLFLNKALVFNLRLYAGRF
jgi:uncharacterized protein YggT (Ycf19 family)